MQAGLRFVFAILFVLFHLFFTYVCGGGGGGGGGGGWWQSVVLCCQ